MRLEVEFLTLISCDFFVSVWAFDRDSPRIYIVPYVHKIRAAGKTVIYNENLSSKISKNITFPRETRMNTYSF